MIDLLEDWSDMPEGKDMFLAIGNSTESVPKYYWNVLKDISLKALTDLEDSTQKKFVTPQRANNFAIEYVKRARQAVFDEEPASVWEKLMSQTAAEFMRTWLLQDEKKGPLPNPILKKSHIANKLLKWLGKKKHRLPPTTIWHHEDKMITYIKRRWGPDELGSIKHIIYPKEKRAVIKKIKKPGVSGKSATDEISSSSGSKAPAQTGVADGTSVGTEKTVPMPGGQPLPAGSKQEATSADTAAKLQAEDPHKAPVPKKPLPKKKPPVFGPPRKPKGRSAPKARVEAKKPVPFGSDKELKQSLAQARARQTSLEGELGTRRRRERLELAPARVRAEFAEYKRGMLAKKPVRKRVDPMVLARQKELSAKRGHPMSYASAKQSLMEEAGPDPWAHELRGRRRRGDPDPGAHFEQARVNEELREAYMRARGGEDTPLRRVVEREEDVPLRRVGSEAIKTERYQDLAFYRGWLKEARGDQRALEALLSPQIDHAPAPPQGAIQPNFPAGHQGIVLPPVANYGFAPAVNVANNPIFHTSWNDTVIALVDITLKNGNIRVTGGNATIRCSKSGKQAKGDIVKITRFIKRYYKLGGFLDGRKMSSQRLIRHILSKLPGIFSIRS